MKLFLTLLQFLPAILTGIKSVEEVWGSSIPGTAKKDLVLQSIIVGAKVGEGIPDPNVVGISTIIDSLVTSLNVSGVFHKTIPVA